MTYCEIGLPATRDLESRLARRRVIEVKRKPADGDSLPERLKASFLRSALRIAGLYSRGIRNALAPVVRHLQFQFDDLPHSFVGFRMLHLADLHIDCLDGLAEIVAERVRGLEADLCVMTGDYRFRLQGPCDSVYLGLRTILPSIRATRGIVGILGNHDEADIAVELENLGIRMLVNDAVAIEKEGSRLWVLGVDDPHSPGCCDLAGPLATVPPDAFKVLLAHSPEIYCEASLAGIHLYLCGHTHAGQIRLPGIGALLVNSACPRSYAQGRWQHGAMLGYTSAGAGCALLPVRYNCAPEITLIELAKSNGRTSTMPTNHLRP
jgi:predicted MPP superfamily phosphohydrolase